MANNNVEDYENAINKFKQVKEWRDSVQKISECETKISEQKEEKRKRDEQEEKERIAKEIADKKQNKIVAIIAGVVALGIVCFIVITKVIIPSNNYKKGVSLMESGSYNEAVEVFEMLGNYKDSNEKHKEAYEKAIENYQFSVVKAADTIKFGNYEWVVIDREDNSAMLATKDILYKMPYYVKSSENETWSKDFNYYLETDEGVGWSTSSIRQRLNEEFYNEFTDDEKNFIKQVPVVSKNSNNDYEAITNEVNDYIFIPDKEILYDIRGLASYFTDDEFWFNEIYKHPMGDYSFFYTSQEFLRKWDGPSINYRKTNYSEDMGVRPVMWIEW